MSTGRSKRSALYNVHGAMRATHATPASATKPTLRPKESDRRDRNNGTTSNGSSTICSALVNASSPTTTPTPSAHPRLGFARNRYAAPDRRRHAEHRQRFRQELPLVDPDVRVDRDDRGGDQAGTTPERGTTGQSRHEHGRTAEKARNHLLGQDRPQSQPGRPGEDQRPQRRHTRIGWVRRHAEDLPGGDDESFTVGQQLGAEVVAETVGKQRPIAHEHDVDDPGRQSDQRNDREQHAEPAFPRGRSVCVGRFRRIDRGVTGSRCCRLQRQLRASTTEPSWSKPNRTSGQAGVRHRSSYPARLLRVEQQEPARARSDELAAERAVAPRELVPAVDLRVGDALDCARACASSARA